MTSKDIIEACDILIKLEQEFSTEESKLSEVSNDHAIRIDELDQQISTFRRNEDVDFRVFSPRNVSTGTSEKIAALEDEKKQLEREKREADKQLKYYSGKTEMIGKVLALLRGDLKEESSEDSSTVIMSRNPFAFLDEPTENADDTIDASEDDFDHVSDLFNDLNDDSEEKSNDIVENEESYNSVNSVNGVPVDEVERVCHKVEFCGKIINNDGIRAKLEIKNIVDDLKELIRAYGK